VRRRGKCGERGKERGVTCTSCFWILSTSRKGPLDTGPTSNRRAIRTARPSMHVDARFCKTDKSQHTHTYTYTCTHTYTFRKDSFRAENKRAGAEFEFGLGRPRLHYPTQRGILWDISSRINQYTTQRIQQQNAYVYLHCILILQQEKHTYSKLRFGSSSLSLRCLGSLLACAGVVAFGAHGMLHRNQAPVRCHENARCSLRIANMLVHAYVTAYVYVNVNVSEYEYICASLSLT